MSRSLEQRLAEAGEMRRKAEDHRHAAAMSLHHLVGEADKQGWSKTKIAAVSGLSRQTVHEILKEEQ